MLDEFQLFAVSIALTMTPWVILWVSKNLTIVRMIILLFIVDSILTVEAAFYSDLQMIAFLHVATIPAFFALIYFDIVSEHKRYFRCFICGNKIEGKEEEEIIQRRQDLRATNFLVHKACIELAKNDRKRKSSFKNGIPP